MLFPPAICFKNYLKKQTKQKKTQTVYEEQHVPVLSKRRTQPTVWQRHRRHLGLCQGGGQAQSRPWSKEKHSDIFGPGILSISFCLQAICLLWTCSVPVCTCLQGRKEGRKTGRREGRKGRRDKLMIICYSSDKIVSAVAHCYFR